MKILNIGSMNLDFAYTMDHIVRPGETQSATQMNIFIGGKGMNQSVAIAKAGGDVWHCGLIGEDGQPFIDCCKEYGVKSKFIRTTDGKTGHAIIQLDKNAQNSIVLFGGANQKFTEGFVDEVLSCFENGDILVLQNEINLMPYIVDKAYSKGMFIVLNPSPFNEKLNDVDMSKISLFMINEIEGEQMTGHSSPDEIINIMLKKYPSAKIVLTLGAQGAYYADTEQKLFQPAVKVSAVDTTAAGDTFTGYFVTAMAENMPLEQAMKLCAAASAIAVTRKGAAPSVPVREEAEQMLKTLA